ncbi:DUF397 domain-containing protein [Streptomonospora nanhaiensis]|uniref:DUF397 domain-containing protein n=1 Tax=Streptomonospora nanhaiensis TaxID=1323731 RepID=A0ABY6YSZ5_9ACTN|nr:DUF397 domain-containing protein [Streptomonospora nanhaiensis]WAE75499.1 DUF397 domain-containing protein [Streptomonospora nanhaiensis]
MTEQEATETSLVHTATWHTSSYSAERGECVEVSEGPVTGVRDTKHRELGALFFTADEWHAFLSTTRRDLL